MVRPEGRLMSDAVDEQRSAVAHLQRCGFGNVAAYGDFDASPYDEKANRLVVVARKS
jgi:hypothetical protein